MDYNRQLNTGSRYIAVKTKSLEDYRDNLVLGECLFAVEREEWLSFGKFITKKIIVDAYEKGEIDVQELYNRAETFEVDENTIKFLLSNGTKKALKYIRKGIVEPRNRLNLYNIFNKLALFRDIEHYEGDSIIIDCVSIDKEGYYGIEKDPTALAWKLPACPEEIPICQERNQKLMEGALKENRNTLISILGAKDYWCDICINNKALYFEIFIPDDTCLWNPDVLVKLKHDNNGYSQINLPDGCWRTPLIYGKKRVNLYNFLNVFIPSLKDDNYQMQLRMFFSA
jgi:hypothetical protein